MKHRYIKQKIKGTLIFLMAVSLSACGVKEEKNRQQARRIPQMKVSVRTEPTRSPL